jgi:hypothetical protein
VVVARAQPAGVCAGFVPLGVHLVGSVPLASAEDVFRTLGGAAEAAADRLELLRESLDTIFGGRPTFRCCWTYITATRA